LWDVAETADVIEDVARGVGYDTLPTALPSVGSGSLPSPREVRRERADEVLVGLGFHEICTDGFYGRQAVELLGIEDPHPLAAHVRTLDAVDRANAMLKNNALHHAIEAVATNERRRETDVALFEWTRTFHPIDHPEGGAPDPTRPPCRERKLLWAITSGRDRPRAWDDRSRPADVAFVKGVVEELSVELGLPFALDTADVSHPLADLLHPGRRAAVTMDGARVGVLGEVHPAVLRRYKIRAARPVYLELDADAVLAEGRRPPFVPPSDLQPVVRSVALAVPVGIEAGTLAAAIRVASPPWLERITIVDVFTLPDSARSVTYELAYENIEGGGRPADEVNEAVESAIRAVLVTHGPKGVVRR
jgi:phenylalanyl-tRNA synthetase beta chain